MLLCLVQLKIVLAFFLEFLDQVIHEINWNFKKYTE